MLPAHVAGDRGSCRVDLVLGQPGARLAVRHVGAHFQAAQEVRQGLLLRRGSIGIVFKSVFINQSNKTIASARQSVRERVGTEGSKHP